MKKIIIVAAIGLALIGAWSCGSSDVSSRMNFYHGQTIPDQYFKVLRSSPEEVVFEIQVDFKGVHMYHILLGENGKPVSEGWYPTTKIGQSYAIAMKPKTGLVFEAGKKYRLCIGNESPEKVFYSTSSYRCVGDYEFILTIK